MKSVRLSFALVLLALAAGPMAASAARRPNFVLIFIDDMGYGDIGPFGSTLNRTPHLDRMADEGMKLTSFYAAPVCSASRAQLLTGCYAPRVGVPGVFFPAGPKGLNPEEITVAEYLREEGYATTCVGKWHLGDQPKFLPTNHGFDHYFGIPYSNDMQRVASESGKRVTPLLRDDKVAELLEDEGQRRVTREYTEEAIKFINENRDRPFFLYLPHTAMHVPLFPHQDFVGKSDNGAYGDWISEVDWSVGQVLAEIRKLNLDENTLVIFTSDNGPWASRGDAGGIATPLRGSKGGTLEGGVREPTICWWPGTVQSGGECDEIVGTTDILPTLVSLAGGTLNRERRIDGMDVSPLLTGKSQKSPRDVWHYYKGTELKAVRKGPWKLAIRPQSLGMGIKEKPDDLLTTSVRLYNLEEEIGEITNVADRHPKVVEELQAIADEMIADIGSGKPGPGSRPAGTVANPVTLYPTMSRTKTRKNVASKNPIDWSKIALGDSFDPNVSPRLPNRDLRILVRLQPEDRAANGMILAHGGSAIGYAIYTRAGKLVWAIRESSDDLMRLDYPLPANGPFQIEAKISKSGEVTLQIDGGTIIGTKLNGGLSRQPQEGLCIGHDDRNPVDPQAPSNPFSGSIKSLTIGDSR